jgi:hypothetical protein
MIAERDRTAVEARRSASVDNAWTLAEIAAAARQ